MFPNTTIEFSNESIVANYDVYVFPGGQGGDEGKAKVSGGIAETIAKDESLAFSPLELRLLNDDIDSTALPHDINTILDMYLLAVESNKPNSNKVALSILEKNRAKLLEHFSPLDLDVIHGYSFRPNGGNNGGHAQQVEGKERFTSNQLLATLMYTNFKSVIGAGVAFDPVSLQDEIKRADKLGYFNGRLVIDNLAEVCFRTYNEIDQSMSGMKSTGSGIRQTYGHESLRVGLKVKDLMRPKDQLAKKLKKLLIYSTNEYRSVLEWNLEQGKITQDDTDKKLAKFKENNHFDKIFLELTQAAEFIRPYVSSTIQQELRWALKAGKKIIIEPSQSVPLGKDSGIEFGTSSPIATSSFFGKHNLPMLSYADKIFIMTLYKSHNTRVGECAFIGEYGDRSKAPYKNDLLEKIAAEYNLISTGYDEIKGVILYDRQDWEPISIEMMNNHLEPQIKGDGFRLFYNEFGEKTSRPRGVSPLDLVMIRTTTEREGSPYIAINMMDGLEHLEYIEIITHYKGPDGKLHKTFPNVTDEELRYFEAVTVKINSWRKQAGSNYHELEDQTKALFNYIHEQTGAIPVNYGFGIKNHENAWINPTVTDLKLKVEFFKE